MYRIHNLYPLPSLSDVILNRKRLQDFSFFIKLSDLLLHQHLRELCLIGAATFLSILQTSVQDAQHESTYGDEEQFRVMVLAIRKNRVKMSGQLQDITHGISAVAETEENLMEGGLVSRRHTQPYLDTKPEMLMHKIADKVSFYNYLQYYCIPLLADGRLLMK